MSSKLLVFFIAIVFVLLGCNKEEDFITPTDDLDQQTLATTATTSNDNNVAPTNAQSTTPDKNTPQTPIEPVSTQVTSATDLQNQPQQQNENSLPTIKNPTMSDIIMPTDNNEATPQPMDSVSTTSEDTTTTRAVSNAFSAQAPHSEKNTYEGTTKQNLDNINQNNPDDANIQLFDED